MKLKKITKIRDKNWLNLDEFDVNQGKRSGNRVFAGLLVFAPFAIVLSCLTVIIAVIGIPTSINFLKASLVGLNIVNKPAIHNSAPENLFSDVKPDSKYFEALTYLKKKGIINGFEDNSFKPDRQQQRGELLKTIVSAKKQFPLQLNYNSCFKDVKNEWFAPAVCLAKEKGWVEGFENKTFQPNSSITKVQALKIFIEAFDIRKKSDNSKANYANVKKNAWYDNYVQIAIDNQLLSPTEVNMFKPDSVITRGESGQILYRILLL